MTTEQRAVASTSKRSEWLSIEERGPAWGAKFFVVLLELVGRPIARFVLAWVIAYYVVFHARARRASRAFLRRIGARSTWFEAYRHLLRFGQATLDRPFFLRGKLDRFDVRTHGHEHLASLAQSRRGVLLLGAHLGSFEAMSARAMHEDLHVYAVTNYGNARHINAVLYALNPAAKLRVLDLGQGGLDFVLRIRELVDAGHFVAMMGDRVLRDGRSVEVPFLGGTARLPTGPYLLAAALGCPVYLVFGLYRGGNRYDLHCEPFAERVSLPRRHRDAAIAEYATRYAERVAHYARIEPLSWFNFFEFFTDGGVRAGESSGPHEASSAGREREELRPAGDLD